MNYEPIWELLEKNQFDIDLNLLSQFTCTICRKILIDAYLGPCGCNYCWKCIDKYLKEQGKYCPGNVSDCIIEELSLQTNVIKDNGVNRRISKLDVKCPWESCDYHCELMHMSDHFRICNRRKLQCPFHYMGCTTETTEHQQMSDHLMNDVYHHNKLMTGWMLDMRNEVTSLIIDSRNESSNCENSPNARMSRLCIGPEEESPISKEIIQTLQIEMKNLLNEKNETRRLVKGVKANSDRQIAQLKQKIDDQAKEIAQLQTAQQKVRQLTKLESEPKFEIPALNSLKGPINPAVKPPASSRKLLAGRRKFPGSSSKNDNVWG